MSFAPRSHSRVCPVTCSQAQSKVRTCRWLALSRLSESTGFILLNCGQINGGREFSLEERFEQRTSGSFRGWLWVITRNQLTDYFRRRSRNIQAVGGTDAWRQLAAHAESLPDDPTEFTEPGQLNALQHRGLEMVKAEFEQRSWAIFQRVVIDDILTNEVAKEFDITPNSVRQTKSRILRRLRQVLGED